MYTYMNKYAGSVLHTIHSYNQETLSMCFNSLKYPMMVVVLMKSGHALEICVRFACNYA